MTSYARRAADRLVDVVGQEKKDDLRRFLSTEKGFRPEQVDKSDFLSALHFAAGREFRTAEEADDWLSYLVFERSQNINEPSSGRQLYPLHCACKRGNIFGVQWLISHGADVNVKDRAGHSPYWFACASSLDRMKKLLILEEHGCSLPQDSVCQAAKNRFESSEEAYETLNYLVNEKGLSVSAIDSKKSEAPLHCACRSGSIFGVKWLVEHNAAVNGVNKFGETPFMWACRSLFDRSSKVRYLSKKGADCQAHYDSGHTELFYATFHSESKDDIKDVLEHLVREKGININAVQDGRTPLLHACRHSLSVVAIRELISLGANVAARDEWNRNALHYAADNFRAPKSLVELLIEKGVDVSCKDKDGKTPHQLARNGEIRNLLRQHYEAARFSVLLRQERVRPDTVKICVIGPEMAGKTTFVNALLCLNLPPIKPGDRTAGVQVHNIVIPGVGKGTTWDFGAQTTFHSAHGLFFSPTNTIFIPLLCSKDGEKVTPAKDLLDRGRYWCAFAKAAMRTIAPHLMTLIRVFFVFNVIGCKENNKQLVGFQLQQVVDVLTDEFGDTFKFAHVLELDCSKSDSARMSHCREKLKSLREQVLEEAHDVPKLCHEIERNLSLSDEERKSPLGYFLTPQRYEKWVAQEIGITLTEDEKKISIEYLDSSGLIVNLGHRICLRPIWLGHNVIGPLLAPPSFPFALQTEKLGRTSKKDIELALRGFEDIISSSFSVTADEAIDILRCLDLCFPVDDGLEMVQIPALLQNSRPRLAWVESKFDVYRGQRYECDRPVDIISPSSYVVFQSRCSRIEKTKHELWKDGVKLVKIVGPMVVECLVELGVKKGVCCIDVVLRWSSAVARSQGIAKDLLDQVKAMVVAVCEERSPGVVLNWFYLDSAHLQRLDEDPAIYSSHEVDQKMDNDLLDDVLFSARPEGSYSSVKDLVIADGTRKKERALSLAEPVSYCRTGAAGIRQRVPLRRSMSHPQAQYHKSKGHSQAESASSRVDRNSPTLSESVFPADEEPVSADLMRACAAVKGSKWEEIGVYLIGSEDLENIRLNSDASGNFVRMFKVLDSWNVAKSPKVRDLLRWFQQVSVGRRAIKMKYEELYGRRK